MLMSHVPSQDWNWSKVRESYCWSVAFASPPHRSRLKTILGPLQDLYPRFRRTRATSKATLRAHRAANCDWDCEVEDGLLQSLTGQHFHDRSEDM